MFHACLVSTLLCFVYTLRCFYMFSTTNLLTSCHSASCLFSSVFGSRRQKINILGIGRDKSQSQYFIVGDMKSRGETERRVRDATPPRRGCPTHTWVGCGPSSRLPASPLRL